MDPTGDVTRRRDGTGGLKVTLALGAGAIALFAIGAVALIWAMGGGDEKLPPSGGRYERAAADPGPPAPVAPPPPPVQPAIAGPSVAAPAPPPPAPEELDPSWGDVPVVFRTRDGLGAVGAYVLAGLRDARDAMKHCHDGEAPRGGATPPAPDVAPSPPVLLLYLEAREGAIDVVEVRTDDLGTADAEVVECCRAALRGHAIRAPNAVPGRRYRLKYALD